jgi:phage-related protein
MQFRVLYTFAGRQTILLLIGFVKKTKSVPVQKIKRAKALRKDYLNRLVKGGENG